MLPVFFSGGTWRWLSSFHPVFLRYLWCVLVDHRQRCLWGGGHQRWHSLGRWGFWSTRHAALHEDLPATWWLCPERFWWSVVIVNAFKCHKYPVKMTCIPGSMIHLKMVIVKDEGWTYICKGTNLEWFYMGSSDVCPEHLVFWNLKLQSTEILNWRYAHSYSTLKPSSFSSHWSFIIEWTHIVTCWIWWSSYYCSSLFLFSEDFGPSLYFFCILLFSNGSVRKKHGKDMSKDKRSIQKLRREAFVGWHQDLDWGKLLQNA